LVWGAGGAGQDCTLHQEHRAHNTSQGFRIAHCADSTTSGLGDVHGALRITHSYRSTHCTWRMVHKARQGATYCTWCMVGAAQIAGKNLVRASRMLKQEGHCHRNVHKAQLAGYTFTSHGALFMLPDDTLQQEHGAYRKIVGHRAPGAVHTAQQVGSSWDQDHGAHSTKGWPWCTLNMVYTALLGHYAP
jgi:hypothetical protein